MKGFRKGFSLFLALALMFSFAVSSSALHGDVTYDENITIDDAVMALKFATGIEAPDEQQELAADLNYDGKITTEDVRLIIRGAAGIDEIPDHLFSEWKTIIEPTCVEEGLAESYCIYCKKTVTKILCKADHKIIPATCLNASYCSVCNESFGEPADHIENNGYCRVCNKCLSVPTIFYNNKTIEFGSKKEAVKSVLGEPDNQYKDATADKTFTVYVYYTDYTDLAIFTFTDNKLTQFFTYSATAKVSQGSSHYGLYCKSAPAEIGDISLKVYSDTHNSNLDYCFYATVGEAYSMRSTTNYILNEKINFHLTNGLRAINGVKKLAYCSNASAVARAHSADMGARNYFDHVNPEGHNSAARLTAAGIEWWACAENIAARCPDPYDMANGWYNSAGHRKNILNSNYTHLGIGFAFNQDSYYKYYGTQNFYKK